MTLTLDTWDCLFGALGKRDVFALALDRALLFFLDLARGALTGRCAIGDRTYLFSAR